MPLLRGRTRVHHRTSRRGDRVGPECVRRWRAERRGGRSRRAYGQGMFAFYSNRLGCGGSLLLSLFVTAILLIAFGVIDL